MSVIFVILILVIIVYKTAMDSGEVYQILMNVVFVIQILTMIAYKIVQEYGEEDPC